MRATSEDTISLDDALRLIGVGPDVGEAERKAAFRSAIKAARPDQPGGDDARFRRLIAAWAVVQAQAQVIPLPLPDRPAPEPVLGLTPMQAVAGGIIELMLDGAAVRVRVAAGARTGDRVALGERAASIIIRPADGISAIGDDLYMDWPISPRVIEDGGRIEIETWVGPRGGWITRGQPSLRLRLEGLGLPARADRARGHLFVTLKPTAQAVSPAETLLDQFARNWTNDRRAA